MNHVWIFLESHGAALHTLLLRLTLREDVAEEMMQELMLKLMRSTNFAAATHPGAYTRRMAINLAMDWRREAKRGPRGEMPAEGLADRRKGPAMTAEEAEEAQRILDAAGGLSETVRDAFILRYVEGESYERIGEMAGKTAHQIRGLCHAGVRQVRERLAEVEVLHEGT